MTKREFIRQLLSFINGMLVPRGRKPVTAQTRLFEDGLIDSMKIIDLMAFIEKKLDIRLDETDLSMEQFKSVRAISKAFITDGEK
jgi:acyl carrier protein